MIFYKGEKTKKWGNDNFFNKNTTRCPCEEE